MHTDARDMSVFNCRLQRSWRPPTHCADAKRAYLTVWPPHRTNNVCAHDRLATPHGRLATPTGSLATLMCAAHACAHGRLTTPTGAQRLRRHVRLLRTALDDATCGRG
eukprot:362783-Chlamydomonas_euryale.AAC.14